MKITAFVLLAAAFVVGAFRLPATPSPRLALVLKASSLLQQQRSATMAWGVRAGSALKAATASDETSLKNWDPQQWIAPAFHNRGSVRLLAVLAGIGAVIHKTGTPVPRKVAAFVHLLSFGANLGAQLYTTFVLGIVMIKMLPRQMFGKLQVRTCVPVCRTMPTMCSAIEGSYVILTPFITLRASSSPSISAGPR